MYHIGIVLYLISPDKNGVVSADDTVQTVVRMWDQNLLILLVDKKIAKKVKKGDYVLGDYTPISETSNHRKLLISKILSKHEGKEIWEEFEAEYHKQRRMAEEQKMSTQVKYIR